MGPSCGCVFCQNAGCVTPDQPVVDSLDISFQKVQAQTCDQLCIPKLCAVCIVILWLILSKLWAGIGQTGSPSRLLGVWMLKKGATI